MNTYEVMFLFDPALGSDLGKVEAEVNRLMERCGARVIMWGKWDERRLAYPIKQHKRAIYVLVYFQASPEKITGLERDAQLSEFIVRSLVVRADHVSEEQMAESIGRVRPRTSPADDRGDGGKDEADRDELNKDTGSAEDDQADVVAEGTGEDEA